MFTRFLGRHGSTALEYCSITLVENLAKTLSRRVVLRRSTLAMSSATLHSPSTRVAGIVGELKKADIAALIIPSQDEHQSEYVASKDKRVLWASGFSGSAGTALILGDGRALLWTDGRYFAQAENELQTPWALMRSGETGTPTLESYLQCNIPPGSRVGIDPKYISISQWQKFSSAMEDKDKSLVAFPDVIERCRAGFSWPKHAPIIVHPVSVAGIDATTKICNLQEKMKSDNIDMYVLSALDDIAWLLNLRGSDIPCNPVFYAFVIMTLDTVSVYVSTETENQDVLAGHLQGPDGKFSIEVIDYKKFYCSLADTIQATYTVKLDKSCSYEIYSKCLSKVPPAQVLIDGTHVAEAKSVKNETELANIKEAHVIDGVALTRFFAWLDNTELDTNYDEADLATRLLEFRSQGQDFIGVSFDTISAIGPNGAIIHYKPEKDSSQCRTLEKGVMYLCDSGGQYVQGTTDLTRTVFIGGEPTDEQKLCFTLVLEGHVELACAHFPKGTQPHQLDVLARNALWKHGLNYNHGTGHGVGAYLGVHEFPPLISSKLPKEDCILKAGNVLSNEPGYYKVGEFGIRIENLMTVVPSSRHQGYLQFETISFVPIQTKLIDLGVITERSLSWLNTYHGKCRKFVGPKLNGHPEALEWFMNVTEPLQRRPDQTCVSNYCQ